MADCTLQIRQRHPGGELMGSIGVTPGMNAADFVDFGFGLGGLEDFLAGQNAECVFRVLVVGEQPVFGPVMHIVGSKAVQ